MSAHHERFALASRILHWLMAAMILTMVFVGLGMAATVSERYRVLLAIHRPLGFAILVLAFVRLVNRFANPAPALPDGIPAIQRFAAYASHVILYVLMFLMPLLGWAMMSAEGYPIVLVSCLHLPPILPQNATLYAVLREMHTVCAYLLIAVFLAHLGAALLHGLIRRDGVFESMAPWSASRKD